MTNYLKLESGVVVPIGMAGAPYRSVDPKNRATESWDPPSGSPDSHFFPYMDSLRDQSRDLIRNEAIACGAINSVSTNVVGQGLRPQSRLDHEFLGITEKEAEKWQTLYNGIGGGPHCACSDPLMRRFSSQLSEYRYPFNLSAGLASPWCFF